MTAPALTLYFAGRAMPVAGVGPVAAYGWVLARDGVRLAGDSGPVTRPLPLGAEVAAWVALGLGLRWLAANRPDLPAGGWECVGDCALVVNELRGLPVCHAEPHKKLSGRVRELLAEFRPVEAREVADANPAAVLAEAAWAVAAGQPFPAYRRAVRNPTAAVDRGEW